MKRTQKVSKSASISAGSARVHVHTIGRVKKADTLLEAIFSDAGTPGSAIEPPISPADLYKVYDRSSSLKPCVDAYVTNIDSFGHHLVPLVDIAGKDAITTVSTAMLYENMLAAHEKQIPADEIVEPTDEQVEARLAKIRVQARMEYARLQAFFSFACPTMSFTELRRRTRQDMEVAGNGYWEVIRNSLGEVAHLYYVNCINMRLCEEDEDPTIVKSPARLTDITWRYFNVPRYFRRFIKTKSKRTTPVYFKSFGDPRLMSRQSGKIYKDIDELKAKEPGALPATEILHYSIFTPISAYGMPRWSSNMPGVLGTRELEEVNYGYFKNNVVPPLALLCSGGRFGKGVATKIEEFIEEHLKGQKGINRILVLEAETQRGTGEGSRMVPKIQFVPLRDSQQTDALFQEYDARNEEKVAKAFRLPRILRGDDKNMNRATAWASLKFAEEQVFEPERELFDSIINRVLLPALGVSYWLFRSNSPIVRDPEAMSAMISDLVKVGVLLPSEARRLAVDIFNKTLEEISEDWTNKPLPYVLAQLRRQGTDDPLGLESSTSNGKQKLLEDGDLSNVAEKPLPLKNIRAGTPRGAMGETDLNQQD